jgi:uncharacterized protein involved in exopolysaccharide biosynthesis
MQMVFLSRVLEALFRRWWLYLALVAIFGAVGVYVAGLSTDQYRSFGIVRVSGQSTLTELTRVGGNSAFGFETPATTTAREINAVIGTDLFISAVAERAGIQEALDRGLVSTLELQDAIWAASDSDLLVRVSARSANPELARVLADATIASYLQWQIDDGITEGQSTEQFFETLLLTYQERLDIAQAALDQYTEENPGPANVELRPVNERNAIQELENEVERASEQVTLVLQSLSDARLLAAQTETDVSLRLRVIDPPTTPFAPESGRRDDALTLMMFLFVGTVLALAAASITALLDRSVRYPAEAERHLDVPVLASLPNSRLGARVAGGG